MAWGDGRDSTGGALLLASAADSVVDVVGIGGAGIGSEGNSPGARGGVGGPFMVVADKAVNIGAESRSRFELWRLLPVAAAFKSSSSPSSSPLGWLLRLSRRWITKRSSLSCILLGRYQV